MMIEDYKIITGFPALVEKEVKELLDKKWQPYGVSYKMKAPCDAKVDIIVQIMVLYEYE